MNRLENGDQCVFDGDHSVGICGDWFGDSSIEGAAISGLDLAEKIAGHAQGKQLHSWNNYAFHFHEKLPKD